MRKLPLSSVRTQSKGTSRSRTVSSGEKYFQSQMIDNFDLPKTYDETNLNLIARSPYSVHAYWDVSKSSFSSVKKQLGKYFANAEYFLRVYETSLIDFDGTNANHSFDVNIDIQNKRHYIDLPRDNASYCADLGYKNNSGDFHSIARSNFVSSHRNGPADNPTLDWASVDESQPENLNVYSGDKYQKYNQLYSRYAQKKEFSLYGGRIPLSVEEIWDYYSKLTPLLRNVHKKKTAAHLLKSTENDDQADQQKMSSFNQDLYKRNILIKSPHLNKIRLGASDEMLNDSRSSDLSVPPSDSNSSDLGVPSRKRNFFFELNTELIVYGRTEPDATVMHGNQNVPLNPDGTFSLRFLLPDGKIPLDFTAESFDKVEKRSILTAVERFKTMYVPG